MELVVERNPPRQLWIDMPDAVDHIDQLHQTGAISKDEADQLLHFHEHGYIIFPAAFTDEQTRLLRDELQKIHLDGKKYVMRMPKGDVLHPTTPICPPKSRLLDYYVNSPAARNMVLSGLITRFLKLLYNEPPLAFQSLLFSWGTEHSIHTDNTYIVADPPCTLIASWIALQDIEAGSGELAYYPGSHRNPLYLFEDGRIEWHANEDGKMVHLEYTQFLMNRSNELRQQPKFFLAKAGDLIIWHSNLVHYGSKVTQPDKTRFSVLTHYCPAESAKPNYFKFFANAFKRPWNEGYYSSRRYDLRPESDNPYPVYLK